MTRRVLLVGSLPFDDEASAMARAIEFVGDRLISRLEAAFDADDTLDLHSAWILKEALRDIYDSTRRTPEGDPSSRPVSNLKEFVDASNGSGRVEPYQATSIIFMFIEFAADLHRVGSLRLAHRTHSTDNPNVAWTPANGADRVAVT